jgi:hypothetical protein
MTNKQFEQACNEFKQKFPKLQNSVIFIENDGDVYSSLEGDVIGTIRTMVDSATNDPLQFSILLTVGEMLRNELTEDKIKALTKMHLQKSLEKNVN